MVRTRFRRAFRVAQVTVEFALILPLLLTLIFGTVEISWLFYQYHTIHSAARLAARQGAIGVTDANLDAFCKAYCTNFGLTSANIDIIESDLSGNPSGSCPGCNQTGGARNINDYIRVTIRHNVMYLTFVSAFFKSVGLTQLQVSSEFLIEDQVPNT